MLRRFKTGLVAHDAVLVPHIDTEGDINMRLHAPWHIMETAIECKLSRSYLSQARQILNALCDLVPGAVVLVGGGIARSGDGLVREYERVEGDNFAVGVEEINGELAGDKAGNGRDDGKGFLLFQHVGGSDVGVGRVGFNSFCFSCKVRSPAATNVPNNRCRAQQVHLSHIDMEYS